jgi:hypothetical protein
MTTQSITRSLVELKTLDEKITKLTSEGLFMSFKTKSKNSGITEEEFSRTAHESFESLNRMIQKRDLIKNLILQSNLVARVTIGGREMSVAAAIEFKNTIEYKSRLLEVLKRQRKTVLAEQEAHKVRLQAKIDDNVKIICGKEKPDAGVIATVTDGITKSDPIEVFDPLKLEALIRTMEEDVVDFRANVDFALSESNATTQITIPHPE